MKKNKIKYLPEKWERRKAWCDFCFKLKKDCIGVKYPKSGADICFNCLERLFTSIFQPRKND